MNPLTNPVFLYSLTKSYISDTNRLWDWKPERIDRFINKSFIRTIKYAYKSPVYRKKFNELGITPDNIKSIKDIEKLPIIEKNDLRRPPEKVLPPDFNIEKAHRLITSGTTGEPLSIYYDTFSRFRCVILHIRWFKIFGIKNPLKLKITNIGRFNIPHSFDEEGVEQAVMKNIKPFRFLNNVQRIYVGDVREKPEEVAKKIDKFNPDIIASYPLTLKDIATLKERGILNANPSILLPGGGLLDNETEKYMKETFNCEVVDAYGGVEGDTIAFRCREGHYHVAYDLFHIESVDHEGNIVAPGKQGSIILTRMFGEGTPIVRYSGLKDMITISDEKCSCGLDTPIIKNIVGRRGDPIVLPNGEIVPSRSFRFVLVNTLHDLGADKVLRYQIIQEKKDKVDILLIIDKELEDTGPTFETIAKEIKKNYRNKFGEEIQINIKEVKELKKDRGDKIPPSLVISKVKP